MKQLYFVLLLSFFATSFAQQAYYNDVDLTLTGQDLYNALQTKLATYSTTFDYGDVKNSIKITDDEDFNDTDSNDTSTTLWLIYGYNDTDSDCFNDKTRSENNFGGGSCQYNREHTYARGLANPTMGNANNSSTGIVADPHNIRPSDATMNNTKANKLFASGSGNAGTVGSYWYPGDEWKGDVARIIMYMYTRYGNRCLPEYTATGPKQGTTDMLQLLLQWNIDDPVSPFEAQRNDYLETLYGNRNPFIDNPALATIIWGGADAEDIWGTLLNTVELKAQNEPKIYPNPLAGTTLYLETNEKLELKIYNVLGKLVYKKQLEAYQNQIDLTNLSSGIYLIKLATKTKTTTKKLIKQ